MPDTTPPIAGHISDMLALERYMLAPVLPSADRVVAEAAAIAELHQRALEARLESLGCHAGSPFTSTASPALAGIAAAIGDVRKTEIAQYLRDTAMSLASAGYTMLQSTALTLNDHATAQLAQTHLADYACLIVKLARYS